MALRRTLSALTTLALAAALPAAVTPAATAGAGTAGLVAGETLTAGQGLSQVVTSTVGSGATGLRLEMQRDGNLVAYASFSGSLIDDGVDEWPVWHSGTGGHPGAYLAVQGDGNAVVYDASGRALWQSGTAGRPGASLVVQGDGNVVVHDAGGQPRWQSGTSFGRPALTPEVPALLPGQVLVNLTYATSPLAYDTTLAMQGDGNLVVSVDGRATWQSGTAGRPGAYAVLQPDGNVVVYDASGSTALWQAGTRVAAGHEAALLVTPGGWLVLSDTAGTDEVIVRGIRCGC